MKRRNTDGLGRLASNRPLFSSRGLLYIWLPIVILIVLVTIGSQRLIRPAPTTIRMLSGPEGSSYRKNAEKYKAIIERFGVKVQVLPSTGALDNLRQLANPKIGLTHNLGGQPSQNVCSVSIVGLEGV